MAGDLHHPPGLLDGDVGGAGGLLDGRLAALLLEQLLGDVAELGHRLDHVDRDADRPGLIGDGAGDGLADPPRRIRAELVAAAILVLVHGPHQPGVPLLDQVEEGEAAVAVLLGDRDDQPEVAAGELALGLLVPAEADVHRLDALRQGGGRLEGDPHQVLELLDQVGPIFLAAAAGAVFLEQEDQLGHPGGDLLEPLHQRLDLLGPDRELLDQVDGLAAAALEVVQERRPELACRARGRTT